MDIKGIDITLVALQDLVNHLNLTSSNKDKVEILKRVENEEVKDLLQIIYDPMKPFNITSKTIAKSKIPAADEFPGTLMELLVMLTNREVTGNEAVAVVKAFATFHLNFSELIYNAIDKNLKCRISDTSLRSAFGKDFIHKFNVALCEVYQERKDKVDFEKDEWYASRKLDGCRCILRKENGEVSTWSRPGHRFETLSILEGEFEDYPGDFVLDGEICIVDEYGNEHFQDIMSEINNKNHTIMRPMLQVFDMLTLEEFDNQCGTRLFTERQEELIKFFEENKPVHARINPQTKVINEAHFQEMFDGAIAKKWEGLVIRMNIPYEGKRSKNMLKCKLMKDAEYIVKDAEVGPFNVVLTDEEGNTTTTMENVLRTVTIEHKGCEVKVGSGFKLSERRYYKDHIDELIGRQITVQYFEETKNKNGGYSLRFPVVKYIYDKEGRIN